MAVEFLDELEKKVDILIDSLADLRKGNAALKEEAKSRSGSASEIEKENRALKKEVDICRADVQAKQEKLKAAAERIQGLIKKIASV